MARTEPTPADRPGAWPALRPGDAVHIVAPSGPFDPAELAAGVALLRTRYTVHMRDDIGARDGYLAGTDARRAEELLAAIEDPTARAVIAARGGYGATRLLSAIAERATGALRKHPKLLVGCSDVTALHAVWQRADVGSLHAHMPTRVGRLPARLQARWLDALEGKLVLRHEGLIPVAAGQAEGRLVGGNLAVLYALLGTPHMPAWSGCIVLLEDVNERPYAIDRMLTALRDSGALTGVAGIVLGAFTGCEPGPDGVTVDHALTRALQTLGVPIAAGLAAGHVEDNVEIPLGRQVVLDASGGTLRVQA